VLEIRECFYQKGILSFIADVNQPSGRFLQLRRRPARGMALYTVLQPAGSNFKGLFGGRVLLHYLKNRRRIVLFNSTDSEKFFDCRKK
jgi:hypothetical protein